MRERPPSAVIFGCAGPALSAWEREFFADVDPFGFILFARNIERPDQVCALVGELSEAIGRPAFVFIDQEGGRVQRLRPPHWRDLPPLAVYAPRLEAEPEHVATAVWLHHRLIAADLADLGIGAACAPVLDVLCPGAHDVIGDRAFSSDPKVVAALGRSALDGLAAGGVAGVVKHIPGHGRAGVDSHFALPRVDAPRDVLSAVDFTPFHAVRDAAMAMTAHVVYTAFDPDRPATTSPEVIGEVIRREIGFSGLLMTDDLSMKALSGSFAERARESLAAGCDLLLHCNGSGAEMVEIAAATPRLEGLALARAERARHPPTARDFDRVEGQAQLSAFLAAGVA